MSRIYTHRDPDLANVEVPQLDLLTLLLDSELSLATDETVLHAEAANPDNKITKAELRDLVERVSHGLRSSYGVGAQGPNRDVVTVITYGSLLVPAAFFGVIGAGGVFSAASPSSTVSELARQISLARSKWVICGSEHVDVVSQAAAECQLPRRNILVLGASQKSLRSLEGGVEVFSTQRLPWERITDPAALENSLITILWSSGTTGLPKGVKMSHLNFVAETFILPAYNRKFIQAQKDQGVQIPEVQYRALAHLPTSHIAGLFSYSIFAHYNGGTVYWMRKYSWEDLLRYVKQFQITAFYTVPSIYLRISKSPDVTDQFDSVVAPSTGSAPMDGKLQQSANRRLGQGAHVMIGQTWGLSETTGAVTGPLVDVPDDTGSIGELLPRIELRLVDEQYRDVEPGREGELLLRGPVVTKGYFDNPEATAAAFHDGWFCTGDIGVMRNDKFYVVDRKKELLKYKGLQVAPAEVEGLLFEHPLIKEAAVIGLPDPSAGDLPRAYVVPVKKDALSAESVQEYVASKLAPHKQLRGGVVFVDEIPKNAVGKFLRRELRDRAVQEVRKEAGARL